MALCELCGSEKILLLTDYVCERYGRPNNHPKQTTSPNFDGFSGYLPGYLPGPSGRVWTELPDYYAFRSDLSHLLPAGVDGETECQLCGVELWYHVGPYCVNGGPKQKFKPVGYL